MMLWNEEDELDQDTDDRPSTASASGYGAPAYALDRFPKSPAANPLAKHKMTAREKRKPGKVQIGTSVNVQR